MQTESDPSEELETSLSLNDILEMYPVLDHAYYRLMNLDANGATMAANDIEDLFAFGLGNADSALSLAKEIQTTCDRIKENA